MAFAQCAKNILIAVGLSGSLSLFSDTSLIEQCTNKIDKGQITYLMQCKELEASLKLYEDYRKELGKHDFETLQEMALILLQQGARSEDPEKQLLSLFGAGMAGLSSLDILEIGIKSQHPETQIAAIQSLSYIQDDRSDELLIKAMGSDFFFSRMEAAQLLAMRKHRTAVGQIEALMYKVPPPFRVYFPRFFAFIGTSDAIAVLRHLMDDRDVSVRVEAILSAAREGRDDLLPLIRTRATHLNMAEQEACAMALGALKDSSSLPKLKKLAESSSASVQLAATLSLHLLGETSVREKILASAREKQLFAIAALSEIPDSEEVLESHLHSDDIHIRVNGAISLLKRRDRRCVGPLFEILLRDTRDLAFLPQFSLGRSLMSWKVVPSAIHQQKEGGYDLLAVSMEVREHLLRECLELPEEDFLRIANRIFESRQSELVPLLVSLLENLRTPAAIELLQQKAQKAGAPLIRGYCNLALFRLKQAGPYEELLRSWVENNKAADLIRFRPMVPWGLRLSDSPWDLTAEESSRLLIESYQALALAHDEKGIDALLEAIKEGNAKNRYVLAGLLILALQ